MPKIQGTRVGYGDKGGAASVDKIKGGDSSGSAKSGPSRAGKAITSTMNVNTDNSQAASHKLPDRPKSGPSGSGQKQAV